jgi:uncharacterized membrane protein
MIERFGDRMRAFWPSLLLVVGSVLVSRLLWRYPWWSSHEYIWYPVRVVEYLEAWRAGALWPRWGPDLESGFGYPFFNYYAPGAYFGAAVLVKLSHVSPQVALKLVVAIGSAIGAIAMYGLCLGETNRRDAALVGGAIYVALPYHCTDLFPRGDLAETLAYCLVPLALWAYRAIARAPDDRRAKVAFVAALAHAAVLLTHTLVGLFLTELVGLYVVVQLVRERRSLPSWMAAAALILAVAIAAIYLVPAYFEQRLVHIERLVAGPYKSWLNTLDLKKVLHDPFFAPGLPFYVGVALWLIAWVAPRTRPAARRAATWWLPSLALFAILFNWSKPLWHVLPFGEQVQFPWRLLGFIGIFAAAGWSVLWAGVVPDKPRVAVPLALLGVAFAGWSLRPHLVVKPLYRSIPVTPEFIRAARVTTVVMDEYLPKTVPDKPPVRQGLAVSFDAQVTVKPSSVDGLHHLVDVDAPYPTEIVLGLLAFPGWKLRTLAGPANATMYTDPDGLLRVTLPAAGHYQLGVWFGVTPLRGAAAAITLLALVLGYPLLRRLRRLLERS